MILMAGMMRVQKKQIYMTSEILINSDGRVLNADKEFCEIFSCKNPQAAHNSNILDFIAEDYRKTIVNAFIDTFYGKQKGKLFEIQMIDSTGTPLEVTVNFFPSKSSNGEKATLLIRKKIFE